MGHRAALWAVLALHGFAVAATGRTGADPGGVQWYHGRLVSAHADAFPFFLAIPAECGQATIVNGEERLETDCRRGPDQVLIDFPVYDTRLTARIRDDGSLIGVWERGISARPERLLDLVAEPVSAPEPGLRFPAPDAGLPEVDVSGTWRVVFDEYGQARGVFEQQPSGVVTGTLEVLSEYGDLRYLAGVVRGTRMRLSTFDGKNAYGVVAEIRADGTMEGEWFSHRGWDAFEAERDPGYELPDPLGRVAFEPGREPLDIEPLRHAPYAGKPVIVEVFGTWCPNCNDQAAVLVDLYRRHHPRGLEILGLAYEFNPDRDYNEQRVAEFRKRHGIEWEILITGSDLNDLAGEGLAGLRSIRGVPVTVFVNPDGTTHAVYSGFSGPATGEAHGKAVAEFERLVGEILERM